MNFWLFVVFFLQVFYFTTSSNANYKTMVIEENGYSLNDSESQDLYQKSQKIDETPEISQKKKKNELMESNLQTIQDKYRTSITPYSTIALPVGEDEVIDRFKGYNKDYSIASQEEEISSKTIKKICKDIGFSEEDQRLSIEFNNCVAEAMKTKLTEETHNKRPYSTIDIQIAKILQSNTKTDSSIKNLIYYEEFLNRRNKLDCLKQKDYAKCVNAITSFKQCSNMSTNDILAEHNKNKIICYVKTGIRFPRPTISQERVRDAYFGVCIHLIEQDLKKKILEYSAKCNEILIQGNVSDLAI
jgi:hypothetical protein